MQKLILFKIYYATNNITEMLIFWYVFSN